MTLSRRRTLFTLLSGAAMAGLPALARADDGLTGTWSGLLAVGPGLHLQLIIGADGSAVLVSVDQSNSHIPCSKATLTADSVDLEFEVINATYSGKLKDKDHLDGTFTQSGQSFPLAFARGAAAAAPAAVTPALSVPVLQDLRKRSNAPGMAAGWQRKGSTFGLLTDGLRSAGDTAAVTMFDQWHLGSITKSMTATTAARLVEAGTIGWDTTIGAALGKSAPDMLPGYRDVSLLHLLSHRAGLQANIDPQAFSGFPRDDGPDPRPDRLRYAAAALSQSPIGAPGEKMSYSNNGYIVAGAMLEAMTGQSWESLIQAQLFTPLKLASAGFGAPGHAGQLDQPLGHAEGKALAVGPGLVNDNPVALGPAGRVHMNVHDILSYLEAHRDTPSGFLKAESWTKLHTPPFGGDYALGWVVRPDGSLWHNGSNSFWYAEILVDKAKGIVATATANDGSPQTQTVIAQVLASAVQAAKA